MKNKTTIKKMVIELNGKDVELTMDQARELQVALNELFEEKIREVIKPQPYPVPEPYPVYPQPWRRPYRWPWNEPIWISRSGSKFSVNSGDLSVRCLLKSSNG